MNFEQAVVRIRRRCNRARFFRYLLKYSAHYCWAVGIILIIAHRFLSTDGGELLWGLCAVPIVSYLQWRRNPISNEQAVLWAEVNSGGNGFVLFQTVDQREEWRDRAEQQLHSLRPPEFSYRAERNGLFLALIFVGLASAVPLSVPEKQKVSTKFIVEEKQSLEEQIEAFSSILEQPDPEMEEMLEGIDSIESTDDLETALEGLDAISDRLEQRQSELSKSIGKMEQLLSESYTDPTQLQKAMESLDEQHAMSEAQMSQAQEQKFSLSEEQKESLSEQMQQKQSALQKKLSNEQLQQLAQSGRLGEGEEGEGGNGGDGEGEECDPSTDPDCKPSTGGTESAPLTFGEIRNVDMSSASTAQMSGDTQVDWENTVQLGQGAGRRADLGPADSGRLGSITSTGTGSATSVEIPPSRRRTVQQFFSEESDE